MQPLSERELTVLWRLKRQYDGLRKRLDRIAPLSSPGFGGDRVQNNKIPDTTGNEATARADLIREMQAIATEYRMEKGKLENHFAEVQDRQTRDVLTLRYIFHMTVFKTADTLHISDRQVKRLTQQYKGKKETGG